VAQATLSIYFSGTMQFEGKCGVYKITTPWPENNINWSYPWNNDGGDYTTDNGTETQLRGVRDEGYNDFPVTKLVKEFVANPSINYGFYLLPIPDNGNQVTRHMAMSEDFEKGPYLTVIYQGGSSVLPDKNLNIKNNLTIISKAGNIEISGITRIPEKIALYALNGREILNFRISDIKSNNSAISLPFNNKNNGIFVLSITIENKTLSRKISIFH